MIKKMTDEEYFSHPFLNQSGFKFILESAMKFHWEMEHPFEKSMAMTIGSMVHCLFLEPAEFLHRFTMFTGTKTLTSKAALEFKAIAKGREIYTREMHLTTIGTVDALIDWELPPPDQREIAGFSTIKGVEVKAKPDWIDEDNRLWDLKTTTNLDTWEYVDFKKYRYGIQAMWYLKVFEEIEPTGFSWLVVGTKPPHDYRVFHASPETLATARGEIMDGIELLKECRITNHWPGCDKESKGI